MSRFSSIAPLALCFAAVTCAGEADAGGWAAAHYPTGPGFHHTLAVGDLNGDGRLDVATPNSVASAVAVWLGQGEGVLGTVQSWPTFAEPQDVQIADLDGDGIPDLVTADYSGGGVTVLRGLGDGTFAPRTAYPVGSGLVSLAAVDLDHDGRIDLAVSKESGNVVAVLPALAGGGFGAAIEVSTGALPHQIAAADLDLDGHPDLAIASHAAGVVSVHLGNGTTLPGPSSPFASGAKPVGIAVADLDGDGDIDVLVSNVDAATVSVLLGDGDGAFAAPVAWPTAPRPRGMDTGDLDGDGIPDVVVATGYPDGDSVLTVHRGVGDGTFVRMADLDLPYRAADCVLADMDGDGDRDIVATGPQAGRISVLTNPTSTLDVPSPTPGVDLRVHPNPARGFATLAYETSRDGTIDILDLAGRRIATRAADGGTGRVVWDGRDALGARVAPGIYLARLAAGREVVTRRFVLLP